MVDVRFVVVVVALFVFRWFTHLLIFFSVRQSARLLHNSTHNGVQQNSRCVVASSSRNMNSNSLTCKHCVALLFTNNQVYNDKKLALHYMRSRHFLLDIAALLPLELLQLKFGTQPLLRFPRFFKVSEHICTPSSRSELNIVCVFFSSCVCVCCPPRRRCTGPLSSITSSRAAPYGRTYGALLI